MYTTKLNKWKHSLNFEHCYFYTKHASTMILKWNVNASLLKSFAELYVKIKTECRWFSNKAENLYAGSNEMITVFVL